MQGREQGGSSHPNTTASDFLEARKTDPTCLTGSVRKAQEATEHGCETPTHGSPILLHGHQGRRGSSLKDEGQKLQPVDLSQPIAACFCVTWDLRMVCIL